MALEKYRMGFAYPIIILVFTHLFQRREAVTTDGGEIAIIEDGIVFHRAMHKLKRRSMYCMSIPTVGDESA